MRIGSVRVAGVSPRFYVILAGVFCLIVAVMVLRPDGPSFDASVDPAFPACPPAQTASCEGALKRTLSSAKLQSPGWIGAYVSAYGLQRPKVKSQLVTRYVENSGLPLRLKVFVPELEAQAERPDLTVQKYGYKFMPATFVEPDEATALEELAERAGDDIADQPLQVGFPQGKTPTPGQAYEITALLWWRSDQLSPPDPDDPAYNPENLPPPSPTLLVDTAERLSASELRAPATQRVDLDLVYQEGDLEVRLDRLEWSSGRELRACVTVSNVSSRTVPVWDGVTGMTADVGEGSATGTPDDSSALAQTSELEAQQSVPGFVTFDSSVASADAPLTLRMPALTAAGTDQQNTLVVRVPSEDITDVDATDGSSQACGSGTADATRNPDADPLGLGSSATPAPGASQPSPSVPAVPGAEGAEGDGSGELERELSLTP